MAFRSLKVVNMNRLCPSCNQPDDSCTCQTPDSFPSRPLEADTAVYALLQKQTEMLTQLSQQNSYLMAALSMFSEKLDKIIVNSTDGQPAAVASSLRIDDSITVNDLQKALCGGNQTFDYHLVLKSILPSPAFKDRAFSISAAVEPLEPERAKEGMSRPLTAKLFLFTSESPPKMLRTTTLGEKIIKGDTEAENEEMTFTFRKVVIKEVTSHFPNGCFFLVVAILNCVTVKPLIVDKFIVKARKILGDADPKKRPKLQEVTR